MNNRETKEPQNQMQVDAYIQKGAVKMGPWTSHIWRNDPRHLCFLLSRYKFCAKMLTGKDKVLEIGCGDAFGLPVVKQTVGSVHGIDFERIVVEDNIRRFEEEEILGVSFGVHDITDAPLKEQFDAAYSLDVIEHIPQEQEKRFMANICNSLKNQGVFIMGTPNITANQFASEYSREGHVNLKSSKTLHELMSFYFHNVFDFSMNDEVVHTGFAPMAHYLLCLGAEKKPS
ncbi:MAG: class I SAM-dependent methyltransferase [Deltaproteobacteria bacterium]|nr:class I SAM-dependent methyltransferase [Deltaproteobacteria bacterium]